MMKTSSLFSFIPVDEYKPVELVVFVQSVKAFNAKESRIGFTASMNPTGDIFPVEGKGDAVLAGEVAVIKGSWRFRSTDEMFFEATSVSSSFETSAFGATESLVHRKPPLLKSSEAQALRDAFADETCRLLDDEEALIMSGLAGNRAKAIVAYRRLRRQNARLLCFLQACGLSVSKIDKVIDFYEGDAARTVFMDPWRLVKDIEGIGFATADNIARANNGRRNAKARLLAGLTSCIEDFVNEGNVCIPEFTLVNTAADRLGVSSDSISSLIEPMAEDGSVAIEKIRNVPTIYLPAMHAIEIETARDLASRIDRQTLAFDPEQIIDEACARTGVTLHEAQRLAVAETLKNRVAGMTGGPGSGKTMTIKVIIEAVKILDPQARILLAAPTGRASQRLSESTDMPAMTIHKLLEWSPVEKGFLRDKSNPLECDLLVVDEFSMVDARLVRDLLRALPPSARFVVVGDRDQLPSVGPGEVLADIIKSDVVPVARLTKVFRQQSGSSIARVAAKVNSGTVPDLTDHEGSDVSFFEINDAEAIPPFISKLVSKALPGKGYEPIEDIQIITPGHNHHSGTQNLNRTLQDTLNPFSAMKEEMSYRHTTFRIGDKVMQTRTSYELGVFNGEIGRIIEIDSFSGSLSVVFGDRIIDYDYDEIGGLSLAYATTVHRSQGSEYPVVVAVVSFEHANMLRRRLLYTAITRARRELIIIGQSAAIKKAVLNDYERPRYTGLAERLREQHRLRSLEKA